MPEIDYKKKGVPSKDDVKQYLRDSQIDPVNIHAIGFELLKLINRVNELELWQQKK